jgi:hypothetical protein
MPDVIKPTPEDIEMIAQLRRELLSWEAIGLKMGRSRYWVAGVMGNNPELRQTLHTIKFPPKEKPDPVRLGAGRDPLPPWHPIAAEALEKARTLVLDD